MTRTKIFLYPLLLLAFMALTGCQQEQRTAPVDQDGERVSVSFSVDVPNYAPMRAMQEGIDENKIDRLELLVFNKEGLMADYALANLTKAGDGKYTFTAQLKPQTEPCVIHFVANRNYGGDDDGRQYIGRKESDVLFSELVTMEQVVAAKTIPMWARKGYSEVKEDSNLGEIAVLRSMAKFTLNNLAPELSEVSYTLCNSYDCGTVAPFKRAALPDLNAAFSVEDRVPTVPRESFLANGDDGLGWYSNTPVYGFERKNKTANPISCLVIRAKYKNAAEYSYYKLDFVKSSNRLERYDLIRNYWYKMTIKEALAPGAASLKDALAGPAVNNLALSEELQAYPSYSDGKGRLEVEATNYIMTHGETTLTFKANYYPKGKTQPENSNLKIVGVRNATDHPAITGTDKVSINNTTGEITAQLERSTHGEKRFSDIIVGVEGDEDLMRIVRVEVRDAYKYASFKVNGFSTERNAVEVSVDPSKQGSTLTFEIVIPKDFSTYKLPMRLRFFTEHFYPDASAALSDGMGKFAFGLAKNGDKPEGRPCYTTIITKLPADRTLRCTFLSNKSDCSEEIEVVSVENLFDTQSVTVKAN
ncbi:hypothetical protein [uncultured Porphyromonas sp.]|uniref:hypothetical protein n=1 Tax=uncultured Porphyromonas sp. TaxID=159274 RepID=UPI00261C206B|nr:hypothetical protein [uncultured Porphyromonas sp.]